MPDDRDERPPKRAQSPTARDLEGLAKKRERDSAVHDAIPDREFDDPVTGNYEGAELQRLRGRRTTGERLDRLEVKHDKLVQDVTETRVIVGEMRGELKVLPELVSVVKSVAQGAQQRDHVTFTAKVDVDQAREKAAIEVNKAKELSQVELDELKKKDAIKARRDRRVRITKWGSAIIGMPVLWEFLKWIAGKLH